MDVDTDMDADTDLGVVIRCSKKFIIYPCLGIDDALFYIQQELRI